MSNILKRINKLFSRRKTSEEILKEWSDVARNGSVKVFKKYLESDAVSMEPTDFFINGDLFLNWKGVLLACGAKEQIEWAIENKLFHPLDVVNSNGWRFRDMLLCANCEINLWENIEKNFNCWFFGDDERNSGIDLKNWSGLNFLKYIYIDSYIHQEGKNKNSKNTTDEAKFGLMKALAKNDSQNFELLLDSVIQRTKNLSITVGMNTEAYKGLCSIDLIKYTDVIAFNEWLDDVELIPSVVSITANGGIFGIKNWHGWRRHDAVMWAESEIMKSELVMKEKNKSCVRSL